MKYSIRLFVVSAFFAFTHAAYTLELPPEAQRDVLIIQLADHLKHEQWTRAYPLFKKIELLHLRHNLTPEPTVTYYQGEAAFNLEKYQEAGDALTRYINLIGSQGKHYIKALQLLTKLDAKAEEYHRKGSAHYKWRKMGNKHISSPIKALPWLEKAAELGHSSAMQKVGELYRRGAGKDIAIDRKKALYWFRKSAEKDNILAIKNLAEMYLHGQGVKQNSQKALTLFQSITELGEVSDFTGVTRRGYISSHSIMAKIYLDAIGVERDIKKGIAWLTKVANDDMDIANELGDVYKNMPPRPDVKRDYTKAAFWYRKTAGEACMKDKKHASCFTPNGNARTKGRIELAKLYRDGLGVEKDPEQAFKLLLSRKKFGKAQLGIAYLYIDGVGVAKDEAKAREWFEKAIINSDLDVKTMNQAKFKLAQLYEEAEDGEHDYTRSFELYEAVINEPGVSQIARYKTAMFYLNGRGVAKNLARARNRMFAPANANYHPAMLEVAAMFENGIGGKVNNKLAADWYSRVAKQKPNRYLALSQEMVDIANKGLARLSKYTPETE